LGKVIKDAGIQGSSRYPTIIHALKIDPLIDTMLACVNVLRYSERTHGRPAEFAQTHITAGSPMGLCERWLPGGKYLRTAIDTHNLAKCEATGYAHSPGRRVVDVA